MPLLHALLNLKKYISRINGNPTPFVMLVPIRHVRERRINDTADLFQFRIKIRLRELYPQGIFELGVVPGVFLNEVRQRPQRYGFEQITHIIFLPFLLPQSTETIIRFVGGDVKKHRESPCNSVQLTV
jgi:hypothetical protein